MGTWLKVIELNAYAFNNFQIILFVKKNNFENNVSFSLKLCYFLLLHHIKSQ